MAKKFGRFLMVTAALGAVAAGVYYCLQNKDTSVDDDFDDDFEDDDFDLDSDLKPVSDREYVSLNPSAKSEEADEEASGEAAAEDAEPEEADSADADED